MNPIIEIWGLAKISSLESSIGLSNRRLDLALLNTYKNAAGIYPARRQCKTANLRSRKMFSGAGLSSSTVRPSRNSEVNNPRSRTALEPIPSKSGIVPGLFLELPVHFHLKIAYYFTRSFANSSTKSIEKAVSLRPL